MNNITNETTQALPEWIAPRLMRLNQADGTEKHLALAEGASGSALIYPTCLVVGTTGSGGGGVCGPS